MPCSTARTAVVSCLEQGNLKGKRPEFEEFFMRQGPVKLPVQRRLDDDVVADSVHNYTRILPVTDKIHLDRFHGLLTFAKGTERTPDQRPAT
jgi:hypothetical protein